MYAKHARAHSASSDRGRGALCAALTHPYPLPLQLGGVTGGLSDGGVRPEMGLGSVGCRGAEPPAIGPRSGKFRRFETLEGHFLAKIKVRAP